MNSESFHSSDQQKIDSYEIREAIKEDLFKVIELDEKNTGLTKPYYWEELFIRFGKKKDNIFFLVGEKEESFVGFIIGEIRAWEFGSPPCGWIFALGVEPDYRNLGVGTILFDSLCKRFKEKEILKIRTMLARNDHLNMSFFRSQGMRSGPFIQLETNLIQ